MIYIPRLKFCSSRPVADLIVVHFLLGFVLQQARKLSEKSLPVARDVLHSKMIQDELLSSVGIGKKHQLWTMVEDSSEFEHSGDTVSKPNSNTDYGCCVSYSDM